MNSRTRFGGAYLHPIRWIVLRILLRSQYSGCCVLCGVRGYPMDCIPMGEMAARASTAAVRPQRMVGWRSLQAFLDQTAWFVAPNLHPDGATVGGHRTHTMSVDVGEVWCEPSGTPEVRFVWQTLSVQGVGVLFDTQGAGSVLFVFSAACVSRAKHAKSPIQVEQQGLDCFQRVGVGSRVPQDNCLVHANQHASMAVQYAGTDYHFVVAAGGMSNKDPTTGLQPDTVWMAERCQVGYQPIHDMACYFQLRGV